MNTSKQPSVSLSEAIGDKSISSRKSSRSLSKSSISKKQNKQVDKQVNKPLNKQVSLYLQNKKRWRVWQGKNKSSKYFSCLKFGSVEKAKHIALEFCKMNNLEVKHCSPIVNI